MSKAKENQVVMDVNAVLDFIFSSNEKKVSDIALTETFKSTPQKDGELGTSPLELIEKVKHETKSGEHAQHEAIRTNLITRLLDDIEELDVNMDDSDMTFGEMVAYNTLFHYGFLKEVN